MTRYLWLPLTLLLGTTLAAQDQTPVVTAVKVQLETAGVDLAGPCGAFAITGRVAWILRAEGWGLITKTPGQNGCSVAGRDRYAIDALAKQDGSQWVDLLINSETDNTPAWQVSTGGPGQPNPSLWAAPFDLGGLPTPNPTPDPTPNPTPPPDLSAILSRLDAAERRLQALESTPSPTLPDYIGTGRVGWFGGSFTVISRPKP